MSNTRFYAGVGARKSPADILKSMELIGAQLADRWVLRSGFAHGADMAFGRGAESAGGSFEMYLPFEGFNNAPIDDVRFTVPVWSPALLQIAAEAYDSDPEVIKGVKPKWLYVRDTTKLLMARNVCQVLGADLKTPSEMVICYTPAGSGKGGTGQAIRIARMNNVPIFDIALEYDRHRLCEFTSR